MFTLFTLPNCPRCDMVKEKLDAYNIPYEINTNEEAAEFYSDLFWPLMIDEEGKVYQFSDIVAYFKEIEQNSKSAGEISQIRIVTAE